MGMNYYTKNNYCEHCGRADITHIGKSSTGQPFTFQSNVYMNNFDEWLNHIKSTDKIYNEMGEKITVNELLAIIELCKKYKNTVHLQFPECSFQDKDGNLFMMGEWS